MGERVEFEELRMRTAALHSRAGAGLPPTSKTRELLFRSVTRDALSLARLSWRMAGVERRARRGGWY